MGDLPDWIQAFSNPGTTLLVEVLSGGGTATLDVSQSTALIVTAFTGAFTAPVVMQLDWYTDETQSNHVTSQWFTATIESGFAPSITIETPIYGGLVKISNNGTGNLTTVVEASSRSVPAPRVLNATSPSRLFTFNSATVAGTPIRLLPADGGDGNYASNALSGLAMQATVAGSMAVIYVDRTGTQQGFVIAVLAANTPVLLNVPLPQGMIGFEFFPTATAGTASASVFASPGQL